MKKAFKIAVLTIGTLLFTAGSSWASTDVYEKVKLYQAAAIFADVFEITSAVSNMTTLTDFEFTAPMISTGMDITTTTDKLGSLLAPGSFNFDAMPVNYFVSFFGFADVSAPKLGQYGIEISQVPAAKPVPAAVWLFGSGLIGLVGMTRRKSTESMNFTNHNV